MNKETEAIFSSTGSLGVARRPFDRLYVNGTKVSDNPAELERNFSRLRGIGQSHRNSVGRSIFRGVATGEVTRHIAENGLRSFLEVEMPLEEFNQGDSSLIYLAENAPGRESIVPQDAMVAETSRYRDSGQTPGERVRAIIESGFRFTDTMTQDQVEQVHRLWGPTFGWELHEVENMRKRLESAAGVEPGKRDVWFSAICGNDTVVSVAMAERLNIPALQDRLTLIESTEWRTVDSYAGAGLMTATLSMLNAQILSYVRDHRMAMPLIYAECNFQSRADRAGYGAGFRIPPRDTASQILVQNVNVNDGVCVPEGKLRDFSFMYLPKVTISTQYDPVQVDYMHSLRRA